MGPLMRVTTTLLLSLLSSFSWSSDLAHEKPISNFQSDDGNFTMRTSAYFQMRMEYGDIISNTNGDVESSTFDIYFRRATIGFYGSAYYPNLQYGVTISGDETPQNTVYPTYDDDNRVSFDAYVSYKFSDLFSLRFGKGKLPYSRIYLVSSTLQAFAERPYYIFSWEEVLRTYSHTHLSAHGSLGTFIYSASIGKAWRKDNELYDQTEVVDSDPQVTGRLSWSPIGWKEDKLSDTPLGRGRHFAIGMYFAQQGDIRYTNIDTTVQIEDRALYGMDWSYHLGQWNLQAELNGWKITSLLDEHDKEAYGWLIQTSYYLPSLNSEPTIRIEEFKNESYQNDANVKQITIGLNKYFNQHKLKMTTNIEYNEFGDPSILLKPKNKSSSIAARITIQFIL